MSMVFWDFLDLHPSYSGWTPSARRAVSVTQGRDALEELDPVEPSRANTLAPVVQPQRAFRARQDT